MEGQQEKRRVSDVILSKVVDDVEHLKKEMQRNTEVTEQVRDLLTSFKVIAAVAKWCTVVVGALVAFLALFKAGGGGEIRFK